MNNLVNYEFGNGVAILTMDDGRANVMSPAMLRAIGEALDKAEAAGAAVVLTGRPGQFSAGFDLRVFRDGGVEGTCEMLRLGAELVLRLLSFPRPMVAACSGHAYPMGAFLLLASDLRIGAEGPYRIGMNEVALGLTVPAFALELARHRLTPAHFSRTAITGEMFAPEEARAAGFLDHVVPADQLMERARSAAAALLGLHDDAHRRTKRRARQAVMAAIRDAIEAELTPDGLLALA